MKVVAGFVGGLLVAIIGSVVYSLAMSHSGGAASHGGGMAFLIIWALGFVVAMIAPTGGKAWRRLLVTSGLLCLCLPIASMISTGSWLANNASSSAAAAGGVIGGGLLTLFTGVFGFFLGAIFLIVGLLCGRTPAVVHVHVQAPPQGS